MWPPKGVMEEGLDYASEVRCSLFHFFQVPSSSYDPIHGMLYLCMILQMDVTIINHFISSDIPH